MLRLENVHGSQLAPYLDALGTLRITVFRDFPYLYDGTLEYERNYLKTYQDSSDSLVVLAFHGHAVIGATTTLPMMHQGAEFQEAFVKTGYDLSKIFYFGESILLPQYRGRGVGRQFFQRREAHARSLGAEMVTFCAVERSSDHPLRPRGYQPLDDFWTAQGFKKQPELQASFTWKDVQEADESPKTLTFWVKDLK